MAQSAKDKAAVRLPDKQRRWRRAELVAVAKAAKAEGRVLLQAAAEAEAAKSATAARELKPNVTRLARQDFEGARRSH